METYKIDFADIIHSVEVPEEEAANIQDDYLDQQILAYKPVLPMIQSLKYLKAIYFTRKTFNGIPHIRAQFDLLSDYAVDNKIRICKLETPARFFSPEKQQQWTDTIVRQTTCLRP